MLFTDLFRSKMIVFSYVILRCLYKICWCNFCLSSILRIIKHDGIDSWPLWSLPSFNTPLSWCSNFTIELWIGFSTFYSSICWNRWLPLSISLLAILWNILSSFSIFPNQTFNSKICNTSVTQINHNHSYCPHSSAWAIKHPDTANIEVDDDKIWTLRSEE